jgi:hypothetical protein
MLTEWMPCGRHAQRVLASGLGVTSVIQESAEEIKTTGLELMLKGANLQSALGFQNAAVV